MHVVAVRGGQDPPERVRVEVVVAHDEQPMVWVGDVCTIYVGQSAHVADDLVADDLWERIAPLLPPRPARRSRFPGRKPIDDRVALDGILFVLRTNVSWRDVPAEKIGCSGITCWRRLREWTEAGVWPRLHTLLLSELRTAKLLDMDDVAVDGSHVRALKGGLIRVRHRSIGAVRAANITSSSTGTAHPWR